MWGIAKILIVTDQPRRKTWKIIIFFPLPIRKQTTTTVFITPVIGSVTTKLYLGYRFAWDKNIMLTDNGWQAQ